MAKSKKAATPEVPIAGFTPTEWKGHMNKDEDWTERLDGAGESQVAEVVEALEHADAEVRALACNLAYGLGAGGLGGHAETAVATLATLAEGDKKAKVRSRARIVHESLAGEVERAAIRRELPWLGAFSPDAIPSAITALDDPRPAVRLQLYLWWANATAVPAETKTTLLDKLAASIAAETDEITRRAAEIARAHIEAP